MRGIRTCKAAERHFSLRPGAHASCAGRPRGDNALAMTIADCVYHGDHMRVQLARGDARLVATVSSVSMRRLDRRQRRSSLASSPAIARCSPMSRHPHASDWALAAGRCRSWLSSRSFFLWPLWTMVTAAVVDDTVSRRSAADGGRDRRPGMATAPLRHGPRRLSSRISRGRTISRPSAMPSGGSTAQLSGFRTLLCPHRRAPSATCRRSADAVDLADLDPRWSDLAIGWR